MANTFSNSSHLFVFLVLVAAVGSIVQIVEGTNACSQALGQCGGVGSCDQRCKAQHPNGQGSCNLNLCTCNYSCGSSPSPGGPKRKCTGGLGLCSTQCNDSCCNSKCASKFKQGIGFCINNAGINSCTCQYVC